MDARTLLIVRPIAICVSTLGLVLSAVLFYQQAHPPAALPFTVMYLGLHGRPIGPPAVKRLGTFFYNGSRTFTAPSGAKIFYRVPQLTLSDTSASVVLAFNWEAAVPKADIDSLVLHPMIDIDGDRYSPLDVIRESGSPTDSVLTLHFPPLAAISWGLRLHVNAKASFNLLMPDTTSPPPVYGTNVWGCLVILFGTILIIATSSRPTSNMIYAAASEWRFYDDERRIAAQHISGDVAYGHQRLAAVETHLKESQRAVREYAEATLQAVVVSGLIMALVAIVALVCGALMLSMYMPQQQPGMAATIAEGGIGARLSALEVIAQSRMSTIVVTAVVGLVALFLNATLSIWRARTAARDAIRRRLETLDARLAERMAEVMRPRDIQIAHLENGARRVEQAVGAMRAKLEEARTSAAQLISAARDTMKRHAAQSSEHELERTAGALRDATRTQ